MADGSAQQDTALTVEALLARSARDHGARTALVAADDGTEIAYAELLQDARRLAATFAATAPGPGRTRPRLGLVMPNGAGLSRALLAATLAGEAAPVNPALTAAEYGEAFALLRLDAVILAGPGNGPARQVARAAGLPVIDPDFDGAAGGPPGHFHAPPGPDDGALVLMTSGSTGKAKVVPLSHRNVCTSAADVARSIRLTERDRALVMWEQFHVGGLVDLLLAPLSAGGSVVLTAGFDAARFFDLLAATRPTWFQGVPTTLGELVREADRNGRGGASSLRLVRSVAAALTPERQAGIERVFAVPVVRTLGMTEAGPLITSTALPPEPVKPGSVGRPAGPRVRVVDAAGTPCPPGAQGEVVVRGDNVFTGYEAGGDNAAAFLDGWFRTGDVGWFDADGDLFLTGRLKEMINRGGEKISPAEVDAAMLAQPGVREAACYAVGHATLGEDVAAVVVAEGDIDTAALRRALAERLAAFKIPGRIHLRRVPLPRTPVGKIDRPALAREMAAAAGPDAQDGAGVPPAGPMETFVAGIWAAELGKPVRDRAMDFTAMDGDSLSAVRIVAAIEARLDAVLPDAVFEHVTTVAALAAFLEAAGHAAPAAGLAGTAPDSASGSISGSPADVLSDTAPDIHGAGPTGAPDDMPGSAPGKAPGGAPDEPGAAIPGLTGAEPDFAARMQRGLGRCKSPSDVEARLRQVERFATTEDLRALSRALRFVLPGGKAKPRPSLRMRWRLRAAVAGWRAGIGSDGAVATGWSRRAVAPAVLLYSGSGRAAAEKTLVVGLTGNAFQLSIPVRMALSGFDRDTQDVMIVVDRGRSLFANGAPGLGDDMPSLAGGLGRLVAPMGYGRVVAMGSSAGVFAAVAAGLVNRWDRVVLLAPARLRDHPALEPQVAAAVQAAGDPAGTAGPPVICARGTRDKEIEAEADIRRHVPHCAAHVEDVAVKNILFEAYRAGTWPALAARLLG